MPTLETVERFIARVEQNAHTEAIEEFYTPDATMQENQAPPRRGRDVLVAGELVVHDRKLTRVDSHELVLEAREESRRLWERLERIGPHPFSPSGRPAIAGGT